MTNRLSSTLFYRMAPDAPCRPGQPGLRLPSPAKPRGSICRQSLHAVGAIRERIDREQHHQPHSDPMVAPSVPP